MTMATPAPGTVYLVGAGPGDPGLLTLRGAECLRKADLVLHDYLANPALLAHAPGGAVRVRLGHHGTGRSVDPDRITAAMVEAALAGRTVVRLKGGDPSIFARVSEETAALRDAGIPYEIVPGVTSGLALAAYAEIALTHHEVAPAVAFVTARERCVKGEPLLDYAALAGFPGTLLLYMGVKESAEWSRSLMEHGRSPDTPVAIVRWCSRARQQTVRCTLATVGDVVAARGLRPPALFVVGEVVDRSPAVSWFEARPLFGTAVLLVGPEESVAALRSRFSERGAEVVAQSVVRPADPLDWAPADAALAKLETYDRIAFASADGVDRFLRRMAALGGDVRRLAGATLVAVGAAAARRLGDHHLRADLVLDGPGPVRKGGNGRVLRCLLVRGAGDPRSLARELESDGAVVDPIVVGTAVDVERADPDVARALEDGEFHWVVVADPASARSWTRLHGAAAGETRILGVGPATCAALRESGRPPAIEATAETAADRVEELLLLEAEAPAAPRPEPAGVGA